MREFTVIIEQDEDGWLVGSVPSLRGCHTQARNMEDLLENVKEAILLCLEVEGPYLVDNRGKFDALSLNRCR